MIGKRPVTQTVQSSSVNLELRVADACWSPYSWSWHVQCFVLVLYFSVSSLLSLQFSLLRSGCVSAWRPPKVVPTTCCSLRFIAISSSDALSGRHAKTAGCGPERGAKRRGRKEKRSSSQISWFCLLWVKDLFELRVLSNYWVSWISLGMSRQIPKRSLLAATQTWLKDMNVNDMFGAESSATKVYS